MWLFCRLMTLSNQFPSVTEVQALLERFAERIDLKLIGRLNDDEGISSLPEVGLPGLLLEHGELEEVIFLGADGVPHLELNVSWPGPDFQAPEFQPRRTLDLGMSIPKPGTWGRAESLFKLAIDLISPFWGEVNDESVTEIPTFCFLNGHTTVVPKLGMANYFGPDYLEFFGGLEAFRNAGFARVEPLYEGVYVVQPLVKDKSSFTSQQQDIQRRLAAPEVFDPAVNGPVPWFREWGPRPMNRRTEASATWAAMVQSIALVKSSSNSLPKDLEVEIKLPETRASD